MICKSKSLTAIHNELSTVYSEHLKICLSNAFLDVFVFQFSCIFWMYLCSTKQSMCLSNVFLVVTLQ